jgi:uncharacterized protein YdcH (DUF465 family)
LDKSNSIIESLKKEKIELIDQNQKQSKIIENVVSEKDMFPTQKTSTQSSYSTSDAAALVREKRELSELLFQKTLTLESLLTEKRELKSQLDHFTQNNPFEKIKQQETHITQLTSTITELSDKLKQYENNSISIKPTSELLPEKVPIPRTEPLPIINTKEEPITHTNTGNGVHSNMNGSHNANITGISNTNNNSNNMLMVPSGAISNQRGWFSGVSYIWNRMWGYK